jgi:hypothetical protein
MNWFIPWYLPSLNEIFTEDPSVKRVEKGQGAQIKIVFMCSEVREHGNYLILYYEYYIIIIFYIKSYE